MLIVELTAVHAEAYWKLRRDALVTEPLAFGTHFDEHDQLSVEDTAELIQDNDGGSFVLGGFEEEALVAIVRFVRELRLKERHKGHIRGLYVKARCQGRGFGKQMMAAVLRKASEAQALEQILLSVSNTQPAALGLYLQFGFQIYGTAPKSLKVDGAYADEHYMLLNV